MVLHKETHPKPIQKRPKLGPQIEPNPSKSKKFHQACPGVPLGIPPGPSRLRRARIHAWPLGSVGSLLNGSRAAGVALDPRSGSSQRKTMRAYEEKGEGSGLFTFSGVLSWFDFGSILDSDLIRLSKHCHNLWTNCILGSLGDLLEVSRVSWGLLGRGGVLS